MKQDHPRMGGEKSMSNFASINFLGSPPRGRGKGDCSPSCHCAPPDHPRMGGEKHQSFTLLLRHRGSPPRGRGKGHCTGFTDWRVGITPAWAGKKSRRSGCGRRRRDHPRMGGEKMGVGCPEYILLGLPPRRRGKVSGRRHKSLVPGITPAWAGKSYSPVSG